MVLKRWEHRLKELGFGWIARLAPVPKPGPTPADLPQLRKILVIRLDNRIGNAVLISPLFTSLHTVFSRAKIHCLLSKRFIDLVGFLPSVDEFIAYDKKAYARNPLKLWRLVRSLKKERFDLVFDASDELELSFNHAVTSAFSGGRFRVGYDRRGSSRWLEVAVPPGNPTRHAVEMHLGLLQAIVPHSITPRPLLNISDVNSFGIDFRQSNDIPAHEPMVIIHPGGRGPKRWPLPRFFALAREIHSQLSVHPVFAWGPAENDMIEKARAAAPTCIIWAGILPFADLVSLLCSTAAYISNDNGIMHLATACGTPTIGIFVVSNVEKYRPLGARDRVFDESKDRAKSEDITKALRGIFETRITGVTGGLPGPESQITNTEHNS